MVELDVVDSVWMLPKATTLNYLRFLLSQYCLEIDICDIISLGCGGFPPANPSKYSRVGGGNSAVK